MTSASDDLRSTKGKVRSLPLALWPEADRNAWNAACRPAARLNPGGAAGHLKPVTRDDHARHYGCFLDFLDRRGLLRSEAQAASACDVRERRRLHRGAEGPREFRDGPRLDLQAAACRPVHCPGPRLHLARRNREGPRTGDAAALEIRPHGHGRASCRSRADLDP